MESTKQISNSDILKAVKKWTIPLSELTWAIQNKLNNTLVWDVPIEVLSLIEDFKTPPHQAETKRFLKIQEYINNINQLRNNSNKPTLQEVNWKTYLVLWQDDIFEVKKQKWPIYIVYHPIKDIYIVYNFLWEDSDQNTILLWWLDSIEETDIESYYKVSSSHEQVFTYLAWTFEEKEVITEVSYYYIWENWETQYFWDYRILWELQKHWSAVFFVWQDISYNREIVIHNWDKTEMIPGWYEHTRKSKSWKHLLYISYNFPWNNVTSSLFDLDKMEFIFEWANRFNFNISFPENDVWTFEDEISWEFHKEREWLARLLGKKVIKHNAVL